MDQVQKEKYQARILDLLILDKKQKILVVNNENPIFAEDLRERGLSVEETDDKIDMQASYDVIILFGMLRGGLTQSTMEEVMKFLAARLDEHGQLLWCVDNKFGLKYWSGMQYEKGGFFRTLESTENEDVISYQKIMNLLLEMPEVDSTVYYPYPDYRYPMEIYSDEWMPSKGSLGNYDFNFEYFRYRFFDESKVWDNIIEEGLFSEFANSFAVKIERR